MQVGWTLHFFAPQKVFVAMRIFLGFDLLFLVAFAVGVKLKQDEGMAAFSSLALPFATLAFVGFLLSFPMLGARPGLVCSFLFGADLCLLAVTLLRPALHPVHLLAGGAVFL